MSKAPLTFRLIDAEETIPLRSLVMRPGRPIKDSVYAGDEDSASFHAGAFAEDSRLVGIVSFYVEPYPDDPDPDAVRFRGMAVAPNLQGQGIGSDLLRWALAEVERRRQTEIAWCNARTPAVEFYRRLGFQTVGHEFVSDVGPHFRMVKKL